MRVALIIPPRQAWLAGWVRGLRLPEVEVFAFDPNRGFTHCPSGAAREPAAPLWVWAFKLGESKRYVGRFPERRHHLARGDHLLIGKRHLTPLRVASWRSYLRRLLEDRVRGELGRGSEASIVM